MTYTDHIRQLDNQSAAQRRDYIAGWLAQQAVPFQRQVYATGTNLFVDLGQSRLRTGVGSHFDIAVNSAGANDNASAIAVCMDIILKWRAQGNKRIGLRVFFFDEEESGLNGSKAYVGTYGVSDMAGLINLEMVGSGNHFALWPVQPDAKGTLLQTFERVAVQQQIMAKRFDRIVTNTADHVSFRQAGLADSFTVTCISDADLATAVHYFKALGFDVDQETLYEIMSGAPLFQHYHKSTDTYDRLSEQSILMTSDTIWKTIIALQR